MYPNPATLFREPGLGGHLHVFEFMTELAAKSGAVDLGKGYQDFDCDPLIKQLAMEAMRGDNHQYTSIFGHPMLRAKLSDLYRSSHGLTYDPDSEITVTCGAQDAIYSTIKAFVRPGDEVIVLEPFYPFYPDAVAAAGGVVRYVPLRGQDFVLDVDDLKRAMTDNTRLIVLNTPHNPTGRVFDCSTLDAISELAEKRDVLILTDEVYEHITFHGLAHTPIATLRGMRDRTITVSSLGKPFGITGWKIGWACAPARLTQLLRTKRAQSLGSIATPMQMAATGVLQAGVDGLLSAIRQELDDKRRLVHAQLDELGLKPCRVEGGFFQILDFSSLSNRSDWQFCLDLAKTARGVALIPLASFWSPDRQQSERSSRVRLCFAKKKTSLVTALERLATFTRLS